MPGGSGRTMMRFMALLLVLLAALAPLASPASAQQQKVIKDQAEYNAYVAALKIKAPAQKAAAMEAFAAKYPHSIVRIDAFEQAMAAWQAAGNRDKVAASAAQILQIEPDNVRALSVQAFLLRARATQGDQAALAPLRASAERGLALLPKWPRPDGASDADFAALKRQMSSILNGAMGFAELQTKDYAKARPYYLAAVADDPNDLQNVYQLSIACLEATPVEADGFWYAARAIVLSANNAAARDSITKYATAKYRIYHGSDDGWDKVLASARAGSALPPDFARSIKPAPTTAELAVKAVAENDPKDLSVSDWEIVLANRDASPENGTAADKVWQHIQGLQSAGAGRIKLPLKVIVGTSKSVYGAITDEHQKTNPIDLKVQLAKPVDKPPAVGSKVFVTGVIKRYDLKPFVFLMEDGEVAAPCPSPSPAVARAPAWWAPSSPPRAWPSEAAAPGPRLAWAPPSRSTAPIPGSAPRCWRR